MQSQAPVCVCVSHYLFSSFKILRNFSALVSAVGCFSFSFAASSAFSLRVFFKAVSWHSGNSKPRICDKPGMQGHAVMFCFKSKKAINDHSRRSSKFHQIGTRQDIRNVRKHCNFKMDID